MSISGKPAVAKASYTGLDAFFLKEYK